MTHFVSLEPMKVQPSELLLAVLNCLFLAQKANDTGLVNLLSRTLAKLESPPMIYAKEKVEP